MKQTNKTDRRDETDMKLNLTFQDTCVGQILQFLRYFVMTFHVFVAYFYSIMRETDRLMNHTIQPAHLIYSNSHEHSLKHDLDIMV